MTGAIILAAVAAVLVVVLHFACRREEARQEWAEQSRRIADRWGAS
jgi:hypothetical protein